MLHFYRVYVKNVHVRYESKNHKVILPKRCKTSLYLINELFNIVRTLFFFFTTSIYKQSHGFRTDNEPSEPSYSYRDCSVNRSLVHAIESVIIDWSHQIRDVLKRDSAQPLLEGLNPGPEVEIQFWKNKYNNLDCIFQQVWILTLLCENQTCKYV